MNTLVPPPQKIVESVSIVTYLHRLWEKRHVMSEWPLTFLDPLFYLFKKGMSEKSKKKIVKKIKVSICHMNTCGLLSLETQNSFFGTENGHPDLPCHHAWKKIERERERLKLCYNCLQDSDYLMRVAITLNSSMLLSWSLRARLLI